MLYFFLGGRIVSTSKIFRKKGDLALEEEKVNMLELQEQKELFLSFAMKGLITEIGWTLAVRFINEFPENSIEKNQE